MQQGRVLGWAATTALLMSGSAQAHMPYLLPNLFDLGKRDHVTVQGSFTEVFFEPDVAMKADDYHVIAPDGTKQALTPIYTQDLTVVEVKTPVEGTYRISTGERGGRVAKAAWVNGDWKFLGEEAAPAGSKAYDVKSITTAETYVTRGKPGDKALAPRRHGLEFRAVTHPSSLFVGKDAQFQVLFDGKPLAGQSIAVYDGAARYSDKKVAAELTTDADGQFGFKAGQPGVFVAITRYRPAPALDSGAGVSFTYSVVFEVTD